MAPFFICRPASTTKTLRQTYSNVGAIIVDFQDNEIFIINYTLPNHFVNLNMA